MKISAITSNRYYSSNEKTPADITKWTLLKAPEKYSHPSQFTKYLSSINLQGDTLLQLKKWWDAIRSAFCQYLSTKKI